MSRLNNFRTLRTHAWYGRLIRKLHPNQLKECEKFITDNDHLNKDDFCKAAVRWGMNDSERKKQKMFSMMVEFVLTSGTMEEK